MALILQKALKAMGNSATYTFDRPFRPLGVRLMNATVRGLRSVLPERPLSVDRILEAARKKAGLTDFGGDEFLEPLGIAVDDFQNAAKLHPFGKLCIRTLLQTHAQNRLLIQAASQRHPQALQQSVDKPLYVIGMPRTGTTLLYNLLCQDPHARPLMIWESLHPVPTAREEQRGDTRPRQRRASRVVKLINHLAPTLKQVHEFNPEGPEEDGWLLSNTFVSLMFVLDARLPNYTQYVRGLPHDRLLQVYDYYKRQLQLLQSGPANRHWVLKSPVHQGSMSPLLETLPTANVIHTHRDPMKVIPSLCSLICTVRGIFTDHLDQVEAAHELAERIIGAVQSATEAEEKYSDRITNVMFDKLVKDPIGTIKHVYQRFGYTYSDEMEAGMKRWLEQNPQGKHGSHKYELEQFGLSKADIDRIFGDYWQTIQRKAA